MPTVSLASPLPPIGPYPHQRRAGAPRRAPGVPAIPRTPGNGGGLEIMSGLVPEQGAVITNLLPMPDYRGFTYQGEQPVPMTQPGPAAQAAAYQAVREVVGPASVEHARIYSYTPATVYGNLAREQVITPPARDPYADPVVIAASPGYIPVPAKRPRQYSPGRQKQLIYPGAWNPYAMQVRAPTLDDVRQFLNPGPAPVRRGSLK